MELEFLKSLVIILGTSAVVVFILGRLKVPSIVGFLIAGIIVGPSGLGLVKEVHEVEMLAEIGVILLMFTIGLEFSLKKLVSLRSVVLGGGFLQVALTASTVALASYYFTDGNLNAAAINGFLVSLSSTAIVVKMLFDRMEINTPYGRTSVGILIFQDLCVVPLMLLVPILAGKVVGTWDITITMGKAVVVVAAVLASSRWGVPHLLHQVVHAKSRELFIITIILLCIGTALLTYEMGLSLALGAFLAGIVISESEYASQAVADILPFKESFSGIFFVSIGMLLELSFLGTHLYKVIAAVAFIIAIKMTTSVIAAFIVGQSLRNAVRTGLYLSQIGEFSFVLAVAAKGYGLLNEAMYQTFLSASVLTMIGTPLMVNASLPFSAWLATKRVFKKFDISLRGAESESYPKKKGNHVIIVGFGVNGNNLAKVLHESEIPYVVLELNSDTVRKMKKKGEPIYYGDGTSVEILRKLRVQAALMLVVAISDAAATRRIVSIARKENPSLKIIARTRYISEVDDLKKLGADEVIPEEFETSVEIFSRVLQRYNVPINVIDQHIETIRQNSYQSLRKTDIPRKPLADHCEFLEGIETVRYLVRKGSPVDGQSLSDLRLRSITGATIVAVQRNETIHNTPGADFIIESEDIILLIGNRESIRRAKDYLDSHPQIH